MLFNLPFIDYFDEEIWEEEFNNDLWGDGEEDENENIISLRINLDNGDYINLIYGQLWVKISDTKLLKKCTLKILEQYGYYAANEIWNFVSKQNCEMPINYLQGMEERDILDSFEETRIQNLMCNQNENNILEKMKIQGNKCNLKI